VDRKIRIGTRGSALAVWQANWVKTKIEKKYPDMRVTLERIKTTGDRIIDVPLAKVGGKGLFVKEIEEALILGTIDLAVHSMKDVPTDLPKGLHIRSITEREDARDVLISKDNKKILELPKGAGIGTSSLRRRAQLLFLRPDFEILDLRGNLDTRIRKLDEGKFDAIVLASAGVKRLGWAGRIAEYLNPDVMLSAIGQGALGIETRTDDDFVNKLVSFFDHPGTSVAVTAERAMLKRLEGGCQVPIAAYGEVLGEALKLTGLVAATDGKTIIKDSIEGRTDRAEELGKILAERLLKMGAKKILAELYGTETMEDRTNAPGV